MKKIITGIIALAAFTLSVSAQTDKGQDRVRSERKGYNSQRINARILEQLNLTETQKQQVQTINDDYRTKMKDVIKSDIQAEDRKAQRISLEKEKSTKIMAILTNDQKVRLKELQLQQSNGEYKEKVKTDDGKTKIKVKNG